MSIVPSAVVPDATPQPSAELLRHLVQSVQDCALSTLDAQGRVTSWNPGAEAILGYTAEEILGRGLESLYLAYDLEAGKPAADLAAAQGGPVEEIGMRRRRDGSRLVAHCRLTALCPEGRLAGFALQIRPVVGPPSEAHSAADLQPPRETNPADDGGLGISSDEKLRALIDPAAQIVWTADPTGAVVEASESWSNSTGQRYDEWRGHGWIDVVHPDDRQRVLGIWREAVENRRSVSLEFRVRNQAGEWRWHFVRAVCLHARDGRARGWVGMNIDVTDQKQADAELRAAKAQAESALARWQAVFSNITEGLVISDAQGNLLDWNPAALRLHSYDNVADVRRPVTDFFSTFVLREPGGDPLPFSEWPVARLLRGEDVSNLELVVRRDDIDRDWIISYSGARLYNSQGELELAILTLQDITERRRSQELLRSVMQSVSDAIVTVDRQGVIRLTNPAAERMFGYAGSELPGRPLEPLLSVETDLRNSGDVPHFLARSLEGKSSWSSEIVGRRRDDSTFPAELVVTQFTQEDVQHFTCVIRDVTARKQLEEQFRQAQKMEAVGRLAGGIAHDFNNLLTVISSFSELLLMRLEPGSPLRDSVEAIQQAGNRAASLTRQLLTFSRKQVFQPLLLDLNDLLKNMQQMLQRLMGENIALVFELQPGLPAVRADKGQLEQLIMNLAVNARDAMPSGGQLTITTRRFAELKEVTPPLPPGEYLQLTVADTGEGMSEGVQAQIFEPFFTTKEPGKGTGLGLAVVHGIVEQSGGRLAVASQLGQGATFRVILPATPETSPTTPDAAASAATRRGSESVLIVEDEPAVREIAALGLRGHGYQTTVARTGVEVLQMIESNRLQHVDLLVADVVLPKFSGPALARVLGQRFPAMKTLFISGYDDEQVREYGLASGEAPFLSKPFSAHDLAAKVREVLDAREPGTPPGR